MATDCIGIFILTHSCICICICISKSLKSEYNENFRLRPMSDEVVPRDEEADARGEESS